MHSEGSSELSCVGGCKIKKAVSDSGLPAGSRNSGEELAEVPRVGVCGGWLECDRVVEDIGTWGCLQQAQAVHELDGAPRMTLHCVLLQEPPRLWDCSQCRGACIQEGLWSLKPLGNDPTAGFCPSCPLVLLFLGGRAALVTQLCASLSLQGEATGLWHSARGLAGTQRPRCPHLQRGHDEPCSWSWPWGMQCLGSQGCDQRHHPCTPEQLSVTKHNHLHGDVHLNFPATGSLPAASQGRGLWPCSLAALRFTPLLLGCYFKLSAVIRDDWWGARCPVG